MKEDFVQYVWKFGLFNAINLKTHSGKEVEILHQGYQNFASGPDFTNAKIRIGNQVWAGNVEIHLTQADWNLHKHQEDEAYNNVILHVVYFESNEVVKTKTGRDLETVFLKDIIFSETETKYNYLMKTEKSFVPCEKIVVVDETLQTSYFDSLLSERLERKIADIENDIELCQGDLDKSFLISLFKYFGAPQNKIPFEVLAKNIDLSKLIKQSVSKESLEALLFGMAGFLQSDIACEYKNKLENEYEYLKQLYQIESPLNQSNWKFAGVRPPNFPTVRLAQLAAVLFKEQRWFSYIQQQENIESIREMLQISTSDYWQSHYNFNNASPITNKKLSDAFIDKIMINVITPFLFYYGKFVQEESYVDRAFEVLLSIKPEVNQITKSWQKIGFSNINAFESQALIELKTNYCDKKRCLDCRIGYKIMK